MSHVGPLVTCTATKCQFYRRGGSCKAKSILIDQDPVGRGEYPEAAGCETFQLHDRYARKPPEHGHIGIGAYNPGV